eukprot:1895866-Rhodomonas_salina.2
MRTLRVLASRLSIPQGTVSAPLMRTVSSTWCRLFAPDGLSTSAKTGEGAEASVAAMGLKRVVDRFPIGAQLQLVFEMRALLFHRERGHLGVLLGPRP